MRRVVALVLVGVGLTLIWAGLRGETALATFRDLLGVRR